tara:strand:- start:165 stop:701 length:537 start_codon:yes stop_codon:yes gene_type:complete
MQVIDHKVLKYNPVLSKAGRIAIGEEEYFEYLIKCQISKGWVPQGDYFIRGHQLRQTMIKYENYKTTKMPPVRRPPNLIDRVKEKHNIDTESMAYVLASWYSQVAGIILLVFGSLFALMEMLINGLSRPMVWIMLICFVFHTILIGMVVQNKERSVLTIIILIVIPYFLFAANLAMDP